MSILDDACRIGRFAVMDACYGHFRDRFHPAVDLDASAPDLDLWCVFSDHVDNALWSPSNEPSVRIVDVVSLAPDAQGDDAVFLRSPYWIPVADLVLESSRQGTPFPTEVGLR